MNNYQQLFSDIKLALMNDIYKKYNKRINEIARIQKKSVQTILDEIAKIILEYNVKDEVMDISIQEKAKLKKQMNNLINDVIKDEYKSEKDIITSNLNNVAKDSYYSSCYIYELGISVSYDIQPVKQDVLDNIINKKIDGKTYSNRIWSNKNKVAKTLKKEINDFLNGKTDVNTISKNIKDRFNVNYNISNRLFRTEVAKVQCEANEVWAKEHNIKKQLFCATLDKRTSKICQSLDGKIYDFDDEDKKIPPLHPNCRSCLIDIIDGWKPKTRIDNETKQNINYHTYSVWKNEKTLNN